MKAKILVGVVPRSNQGISFFSHKEDTEISLILIEDEDVKHVRTEYDIATGSFTFESAGTSLANSLQYYDLREYEIVNGQRVVVSYERNSPMFQRIQPAKEKAPEYITTLRKSIDSALGE